MNNELDIRPATEADLPQLDTHLPSTIPNFHLHKLREQDVKDKMWLIAWLGDMPVAHVQIQWHGDENSYVKKFVVGVPNIDSLHVKEEFRGQGIGTRIMKRAEELTKLRGYREIGLSVNILNHYAIRFYQKIGYNEWSHGTYEDSSIFADTNGHITKEKEIRTYMIKQIE